jgi:hypothetical protein
MKCCASKVEPQHSTNAACMESTTLNSTRVHHPASAFPTGITLVFLTCDPLPRRPCALKGYGWPAMRAFNHLRPTYTSTQGVFPPGKSTPTLIANFLTTWPRCYDWGLQVKAGTAGKLSHEMESCKYIGPHAPTFPPVAYPPQGAQPRAL